MPGMVAGVSDGVLDEVTEKIQFVKFGLDIATEPELLNQTWEKVQNLKWEQVKKAVQSLPKAIIGYENYAQGGQAAWHQGGKHAVVVAGAIWGGVKFMQNLRKKKAELGNEPDIEEAVREQADEATEQVGNWSSFLDNIGSSWDDVTKNTFRLEVEGNPSLRNLFSNADEVSKIKLANVWKRLSDLSGEKAWVKNSAPLLEKLQNRSDDFIDKVKSYYSNYQKPSGMGNPPFVHQGTPFNEFGHPNFAPEVPNMQTHGKIKYVPDDIPGQPALIGTGTDMNRANSWAKQRFGLNNFDEGSKAGRCKIRDPSSPYADQDGWVECVWHHHEDAKTMIPVPIQTHNREFPTGSPHIGGATILTDPNKNDLIGFFNSITEF
jgi:hypothetical protein